MKKSNRKKAATESGVEESEISGTAATENVEISEETAAANGAVIGVNAQTAVADEKTLSKSEKRKRVALNWILMAVGIIMMSASVYFFQTPNDLTLGGIAGIAIVLNKLIYNASPDVAAILTQGVIMAIINVLLLVLGLIILGKQCTVKTIFCSICPAGRAEARRTLRTLPESSPERAELRNSRNWELRFPRRLLSLKLP